MRVCSLFSGIGGIDLGFKQAGFEIIWANEVDAYACKTYRHNFQNTILIEEDIRKVNEKSVPDCDIITAGFPCQPFSICGKQNGFQDERGNLFFDIMRIVDAKTPKIIFLENVANLVNHDNGHTFNIIHNELASRDYIIRYLVADACDYGIPQHRTRIYIVAFNNKMICDMFCFPQKTKLEKHIFDLIEKTVQANGNLYLETSSKQFSQLNSAIKDDNQIYRFSDFGIQSGKDEISFTLKANMGTWYNRVPYIKDKFGIRNITPSECLLLQGFPDNYKFPDVVPIKEQYKQVGNTVCVPVVKSIAEQIRNKF